MAITLVQHAAAATNFTSGTSGILAPAFASNVTAGNCIIAVFSIEWANAPSPTVSSVTTNGSAENWAQVVIDPSGISAIYADPNSAGGNKIIDITIAFGAAATGTNSVDVFGDIYEVAGLTSSSTTDKTNNNESTGTSWTSLATATTTNATEFWVGVVNVEPATGTITVTGPTSPWNNEALQTVTLFVGGTTLHVYQLSGYQITSSTGTATYSGTSSASVFFTACVATFKGAAGGTAVALTAAQVNISAPAPTVKVSPQLTVVQVNINALTPKLAAGPISLTIAQVNINARAPGVSSGPVLLPVAQVNINARAPAAGSNVISLTVAQVTVNAPPLILVKAFALPVAAVVIIAAFPVGIPSSKEDSIVPLMATGVYSNV